MAFFRDWTDAQIARLPAETFNTLVQREAHRFQGDEYNPSRYQWGEPPTTDVCRVCYAWRRYPVGQRHFGFAWWRICDANCPHEHHRDEVWLAAS